MNNNEKTNQVESQEMDTQHHNMHPIYLRTFIALTILTVVEIAASYLPEGTYRVVILLLLAVSKAALVGAIFMHVKYDKHPIFLTVSVFLVPLIAGSILIFTTWKDFRGVAGA